MKTVRRLKLKKKKKKKKKKKTIPFRGKLQRALRPFPGPIQVFTLGAINHTGKPLKTVAYVLPSECLAEELNLEMSDLVF